jgi:hypothetical protein
VRLAEAAKRFEEAQNKSDVNLLDAYPDLEFYDLYMRIYTRDK